MRKRHANCSARLPSPHLPSPHLPSLHPPTNSHSSLPTSPSPSAKRWKRGALASPKPCCDGKGKGIAPAGWRSCSIRKRPRPSMKQSPPMCTTSIASKGAIVACLSTQGFVDELIAAIDGNRVDWWRARYRRATALLLDDIQLLAGKERTQEELFNLFNQFLDADRQLIFTAPAHPNTLEGLEERIISRLEGGLVAEVSEPDKELRRNALERFLKSQHLPMDVALLDYLADRPTDSVRSLTGIVQRVVEAAAAQGAPVNAGLARDVLEGSPSGRRTTGLRTSGIVVSSAGGVRSREKMVWDWPASSDRVIEELR